MTWGHPLIRAEILLEAIQKCGRELELNTLTALIYGPGTMGSYRLADNFHSRVVLRDLLVPYLRVVLRDMDYTQIPTRVFSLDGKTDNKQIALVLAAYARTGYSPVVEDR